MERSSSESNDVRHSNSSSQRRRPFQGRSADSTPSREQPNNMPDINAAEQNPERSPLQLLQLALKKELADTRTFYEWIIKFQKAFDLKETWVQKGLQKLGIKDLENTFTEFLKSRLLTDKIKGSVYAIDEIVDGYGRLAGDTSKIVDDTERFKELNNGFRPLHYSLKTGIPIETSPKQIKGLQVIKTPGNVNNCLIHALLKVSKPSRGNYHIEKQGSLIREILKYKMEEKFTKEQEKRESKPESALDENAISELRKRCDAVKCNEMLDLGSFDGLELINFLKEDKIIDRDRGIHIYKEDKSNISFFEQVEHKNSTNEPYTLFLQQDFHFEAMISKDEAANGNESDDIHATHSGEESARAQKRKERDDDDDDDDGP